MDWDSIATELLVTLFGVLLTVLLRPLIVIGFQYIRTKNEWMAKTKVDEEVEEMLLNLVHEAEVTLVAKIKEAKADGKLTKEEGKMIKDEVVRKILELLTEEQKKILQTASNDLSAYLASKLQRVFDENKDKLPTTVAKN